MSRYHDPGGASDYDGTADYHAARGRSGTEDRYQSGEDIAAAHTAAKPATGDEPGPAAAGAAGSRSSGSGRS